MGKNLEEKKMTLEEYQKKYSKPENIKTAKAFLFIGENIYLSHFKYLFKEMSMLIYCENFNTI